MKNHNFDFLTGSERFFGDFEKNIFSTFFQNFSIFCENHQKSLKRNVFGTNARRERDFQVENSQNGTGIIDFRSTGTHFMTFVCFFCFP